MFIKKISIAAAVSVLATGAAYADCSNSVPIRTIANAFPALEAMTAAMQACGNVESEHDKDHRLKMALLHKSFGGFTA